MKKRLISTLLALCMALTLLPVTTWAAEPAPAPGMKITPTGIRADSVFNAEGYGSLKINGNWDNFEEWPYWDEDFLAGLVNPQIALIDRTGKLLFPYIENVDEYGRDRRYEYSDGIVSLTWGAYAYEGIPEYYRLDGTKAFPLEESFREYTEDNTHVEISTSYVGGNMRDGYAVIAEMATTHTSTVDTGSSSGATRSGPTPTYKIIDKNGKVTGTLPEEFNIQTMGSDAGFSTQMSLNTWCGEGLFAFFDWSEGKGYIDFTGKTAIDLTDRGYTNLGAFYSGMAWVVAQDGVGYIDKTGAQVIPCVYEVGGNYSSDGLVYTRKDGKYGYIDKAGKTVIPFEYDDAYGAGGGLAAVVKNGKCGLVDYNNNVVVPLEYDDISSFEEGVAYAVKDGLLYIITKDESAPADTPSTPTEPSTPTTPTAPSTPAADAVLSPQKLAVDGRSIDCEKYNIGGSNYFKLRDLAQLLNGTGSQFGVGFDQATATVSITTGEAYASTGTELVTGVDNSSTAQTSSQSILVNGAAHGELTVYNIGGSNFFQLRELGNLLGFEVGYDADTNTAIVRSAQ